MRPLRRAHVVVLSFLALLLVVSARDAIGGQGVIVALGDSLTAGLGVAPDETYPARLQQMLDRDGYNYRVVNAGASGDTTAGGRRRLAWALKQRPDIMIVALGANDGLRGQPPTTTRENLTAILDTLQSQHVGVLLAGMRMPPNYGREFSRDFQAVFTDLGKRPGVAFMPFLLEGVAADPRLNQPDGIHPTAAGYKIIAQHMYAYLKPLLQK
jgi:acyl-CoA thioesterase I